MELQQLKAKNHGLNTQMDALAADHERLGALLAAAEKVMLLVVVIANRYRPSTVSNQRGVSYDASDTHTNMAPFSRPVSSTKPRRSWTTAQDSYRGFRLGH